MRLLIAGGGTGGHLFPAIAIGKAFLDADQENEVLFVGTKRGLEKKVLNIEGFKFEHISALPLVGKGIFGILKSVFMLPVSLFQAFRVLRRFKPDFAVGVGGYSSGPVILGAFLMGINTGIQEQNIFPGMTNKILGKFVDTVFLSFKEAKMFFNEGKVCITGNPVRQSLFEADAKNAYSVFSLDENKFTILVFGGSLGAKSINDAFVSNLKRLQDFKDNIQFIHQTGEDCFLSVKEAYDDSGIEAFITPFIYNMHDAYEVADVIVCRAGATSISELAALEKAAVLVPYPFAAADHQTRNAETLAEQNAAIVIKDENLSEHIFDVLTGLFNEKEKLVALRNNISKFKKIDAANEIIRTIVKKVTGKSEHVS